MGTPLVFMQSSGTTRFIMHSAFENRLWLAWLVKVRVLILTIVLGIELAIAQFTTISFPLRLFVGTILLAYAVSFFYLALLKIGSKLQLQSALQVASDLLLVSLLVYITGGVDSSLNCLYPIVNCLRELYLFIGELHSFRY